MKKLMKVSDEKFLEKFEELCNERKAGSVELMLYHVGMEVIGLLEEIRDQGEPTIHNVSVSGSNSKFGGEIQGDEI